MLYDLPLHTGASKTRLRNALAKSLANPTVDYVRGKMFLSVYYDFHIEGVIKSIVFELAKRRPYLPDARSWAKDLDLDIRKEV